MIPRQPEEDLSPTTIREEVGLADILRGARTSAHDYLNGVVKRVPASSYQIKTLLKRTTGSLVVVTV